MKIIDSKLVLYMDENMRPKRHFGPSKEVQDMLDKVPAPLLAVVNPIDVPQAPMLYGGSPTQCIQEPAAPPGVCYIKSRDKIVPASFEGATEEQITVALEWADANIDLIRRHLGLELHICEARR